MYVTAKYETQIMLCEIDKLVEESEIGSSYKR